MYFCNARCFCLWSVQFLTNPHRPDEQKALAFEMSTPSGERRRFANLLEVAQWSSANALKGDTNPWLENGIKLT
jgi:hypothetical protein